VVDLLKKPMSFDAPAWTSTSTLPGGDLENSDFGQFLATCQKRYAWLDDSLLYDYARNYGTEIEILLEGCAGTEDLGESFGGGLFACEVNYLMTHEWAEEADDVIWRRSKRGLRMPAGADSKLQAWMDRRNADRVA